MTDAKTEPVIIDRVWDMVLQGMSVLAGMQLDLFTPLKDGPRSTGQLAASLGVEEIRLRPLLYALVVVGLLTEDDGLFANTAEADHYLVQGHAGYRGNCHKFWSNMWSSALQIAESIRNGKPQAEHDYVNMPADELEEFICSMDPSESGTWLARNYDFSSCQAVLDVGGGSGGLAIRLAEILPHLQVTVVELPSVAPITRRFVERAGAAERVQVQAVDIVRQPLIGTYDAAILSAFLQVMSLEEASQALFNLHQALKPGGTIYILDIPLDDSRLTPESYALFAPIFNAIYERGQKLTVQEYRGLVKTAGFEDFELHADRFITAQKPVCGHPTGIRRY